ncbi:hypothetical protein L6452_20939 [Arctium lappa]|uniref:Uncharacterized protein n=1 Tax=Arctium lappa TaxID=4217 RepID=A0ACB9BCA8_ARCLA|nr:hypothetical protein L6452_20939 [Arctium lappa]
MEQKHICSSPICDRLTSLSANYPWLVAQTFEQEEADVTSDQVFFTVNDPMSHYRCHIPELLGRHIRGCFHGWLILTNHPHGDKWSLWNPVASKFIRLPRLIVKDGDSDDIRNCCLSSPPGDPGSVILMTRNTKPNFLICRLDRKRKRLRWTEMSYFKQLRCITGVEYASLFRLTCCNGKVYALTDASLYVIYLQIVVNDKEVVITLSPFVNLPDSFSTAGSRKKKFLKGSSQELFTIIIGLTKLNKKNPVDVCLYKLDMSSMVWAKMNELKGMVFFVDMTDCNMSVTCSPAIASELGGYIHIINEKRKVIHSYDIKDKSISMSYMHCLDLPPRSRSGDLQSHISVWTMPEFRLQGVHGEAKCKYDSKQVDSKEDEMVVRSCKNDEIEFNNKTNDRQLLNIPFHILELIMKFCIGVEYLNFRATCKRCHLAAPVIQWSDKRAQRRLQTYSLNSPWLMKFEKDRGIITFTDPMFDDKYFIKTSQELCFDTRILCSRFGWLLLFVGIQRVVFFNPFTSDMRELPNVPHLDCFCFSAPPTSPDCMVVGFLTFNQETTIYLHFVARESSWRIFQLDHGGGDSFLLSFPIFCGRDVYVLSNEGRLHVFKDYKLSFETVVAEAPKSCCIALTEYFLVTCDQHLLLVIVGDFGESIEVFKLNDSTKEWEKMDGLGRHMIYICGTTPCVCMDAIIPEMENKIYFPLYHSKNKKMVFYSLETCKYHTFNGKDVDKILRGVIETKRSVYAQAWIEPSWVY